MNDATPSLPDFDDTLPGDTDPPDEAALIQGTLRALAARTSHPVVRACLEECLEEIAHLTASA